MKSFYKFLFYKLYRFAISNERSVSLNLSFISLATIFEGFHLALLGIPLKYYKIHLNLDEKIVPVLFLLLGYLFNYYYFIRNKKIETINSYYQRQRRVIWKDNLLFFGYVILLFFIIFIQIYLLKS